MSFRLSYKYIIENLMDNKKCYVLCKYMCRDQAILCFILYTFNLLYINIGS